MYYVLILIAAFPLLVALWTLLGFVFHYAGLRAKGAEVPRLALYFRAWFWESWYNTLSTLWYATGVLPPLRRIAHRDDGGPPIILLPGYGMNKSYLAMMTWRLRRRGYRNVHALNLTPLFGSIEVIGERLAARLRQISEAAHAEPVTIIAHSMGGVVARWCVQTMPDLPVAKLITLGSPHAGTWIARYSVGKNGVQLRPNSTLFQQLQPNLQIPMVSIYTTLDSIVLPAESSKWGDNDVTFAHCSHNTLIFDRTVFAAILRELPAKHPLQAPDPVAMHR